MSEQDKLTDEVVRDTFQWGATACACCAEYRDEDGVKFDAWLAEHDAELIDSLIEGIGSGTYTHQVGEGIEVALDQLHAAKAELREERA